MVSGRTLPKNDPTVTEKDGVHAGRQRKNHKIQTLIDLKSTTGLSDPVEVPAGPPPPACICIWSAGVY